MTLEHGRQLTDRQIFDSLMEVFADSVWSNGDESLSLEASFKMGRDAGAAMLSDEEPVVDYFADAGCTEADIERVKEIAKALSRALA